MNQEYELNKKNAIIAYLYNGLKDVYAALPDEKKQQMASIMNGANQVAQDSGYIDYQKEEISGMIDALGFDVNSNTEGPKKM